MSAARGGVTTIVGDCVEAMAAMAANSVDAIVTDPPYGIGFMGKQWDCSVPGERFARAALRVLKPGGHLLAFAATRTQHRLMVALEDSGFELRDVIAWVQWQGFPKSLDVSKAIDKAAGAEREVVGQKWAERYPNGPGGNTFTVGGAPDGTRSMSSSMETAPATDDAKRWQGWGTALKPAWEPCVVARKPLSGTVAANVLEHGTGAINIDGCRYAYGDQAWPGPQHGDQTPRPMKISPRGLYQGLAGKEGTEFWCQPSEIGRFPANLYACPKPSTREREAGLSGPKRAPTDVTGRKPGSPGQMNPRAGMPGAACRANIHPTVKPVGLMRWLVRLVTPPGGVCLDPFMGSGTTGMACAIEGVDFIGVEMSREYAEIARRRIAACRFGKPPVDAAAPGDPRQSSLF
jgi:site-specific DNA-methyltransferase (adenine-specific)